MHLRPAALIAALAVLLVPVASSSAADEVTVVTAAKRTLTATKLSKARCDQLGSSSRGVRRVAWTARMAGFASVALRSARSSDWDLAIFDSRGRLLAGSMAFGSSELAESWVQAGDRLMIQACRRSGRARTARIAVRLADVDVPAEATNAKPQLLSVSFEDQADLAKIEELGLDLTHHIHDGQADVIVAGPAQRELLTRNGYTFTTEIEDLQAHFRRSQAADLAYTTRLQKSGSPLPSGRTSGTYRRLTDYQTELKQLAEQYPAIVKPMTLPRKSFQGRPLDGVEIAKDVRASEEDGRPVYFVVALHHAREWPSAEAAMEFAHMLAKGYGSNARITSLLERARVVIVPLINPDGFVSSRGFPADPADVLGGGGDHEGVGVDPNAGDPCEGRPLDQAGLPAEACAELRTCILTGDPPCEFDLYLTEGIAPPGGLMSYRRKNCNGAISEPGIPCELQYGVDPNRNYGQFWGGPGSDSDVGDQGYRGTRPWSESETTAVHEYSQRRQITTIITIHNVAALVLRPPGTSTGGQAPDEPRLKQIGDAMANATGYTSQYGFQLYDTAGTTEDWNYAAAGTYGFTIEIGPENGEFHMPYETGFVDEWTGESESAQGRGGLAEALLVAGEAAANGPDHSILTGATAPRRVLRLRKDFATPSWHEPFCRTSVGTTRPFTIGDDQRCVEMQQPFEVADFLESTLTVPASGRFTWHVNPSTRPFVGKGSVTPGELVAGRTETFAGDGALNPAVSDAEVGEPFKSIHEFDVTAEDATARLAVDLTWGVQAEDYDLNVCRIVSETQCDPLGKGSGTAPGQSGNFGTFENVTIDAPPVGRYRATIVHYATAANDYELTASHFRDGGSIVVPGRKEPWILTCETASGEVLQRAEVIVDRGEVKAVDLALCGSPPKAPKGRKPPKG